MEITTKCTEFRKGEGEEELSNRCSEVLENFEAVVPDDLNAGAIELRPDEVIFRQDLYPRIKWEPTWIQRYADNPDLLPPIEVNQNNILIDGYHL